MAEHNHKLKRAQAWYLDIFIGILIFITAFSILLKTNVNFKTSEEDTLAEMTQDGNRISETLLSQGIPDPWTSADVIVPGIITNNRVDQAKLTELMSMDYDEQRTLMRSRFDFLVQFENTTATMDLGGGELYFGKPGTTPDTITDLYKPSQVLKIVRLTIYQSQIARMEVYIWD